MNRSALRLAFAAVAIAAVTVARPVPAQSNGWVSLIGKDLSNWDVTGTADWKIGGGIIEATKARGFLLTKQSYTDFDLRGEVYALADSNGGFLFRITNPKDPGIENGYEFNINDNRADQTGRTGSIVNVAKPLFKFDSAKKWTKVEISARGPHMTGKLDGKLVTEADDTKYPSGPVSLQAAGGLIRYRNVQIRRIK